MVCQCEEVLSAQASMLERITGMTGLVVESLSYPGGDVGRTIEYCDIVISSMRP